jgi:hypothetical protein
LVCPLGGKKLTVDTHAHDWYCSSMDLMTAERTARSLMEEHGLTNVDFAWNRGKKMMGLTRFRRTPLGAIPFEISLSKHFVPIVTDEEVLDTILHEIAHALAGLEAGHGYRWKAKARELGAKPLACQPASARPEAKYTMVCPNGHSRRAHRKPLRVRSCGTCAPHRFDTSVLLALHEAGKPVSIEDMPVKYRAEYWSIQARV